MGDEETSGSPGEYGAHGPVTPDADFIVVGSGAGGGTVAARLAESGFRVLLLDCMQAVRSQAAQVLQPARAVRGFSTPDGHLVGLQQLGDEHLGSPKP